MMQSRQSSVVVGPAGAPFHRRRGEGCARALLSFGGSATPISLPTLLVPSCGAFIRYECRWRGDLEEMFWLLDGGHPERVWQGRATQESSECEIRSTGDHPLGHGAGPCADPVGILCGH